MEGNAHAVVGAPFQAAFSHSLTSRGGCTPTIPRPPEGKLTLTAA